MLFFLDNFFTPNVLNIVTEEIKKLEFFEKGSEPDAWRNANYPGKRTDNLTQAHPLLDSYIIKHIESVASPWTQSQWSQNQYAYLRLKEDNEGEWRHQDPYDWAYLIYLSTTNLKSGTKFFASLEDGKDDEIASVSFVQNRLVMFNSDIPHRSFGNYGTCFKDGRLTINGFCEFR